MIDCEAVAGAFAADVFERAEECKWKIKGGMGVYLESKGVEFL